MRALVQEHELGLGRDMELGLGHDMELGLEQVRGKVQVLEDGMGLV